MTLGALAAFMATPVAVAAAEEGDSAPVRPVSEDGLAIPEITFPSAPEQYPFEFELGEEQSLHQVSDTEVDAVYTDGSGALRILAPLEHDANGANVPTTLLQTGEDIVTVVVHHRAGNPLAGGAPFDYPISAGAGWEGGYRTISTELNEPHPSPPATPTITPPPAPAPPTCAVPPLHGLSLRAAKVRLLAADCRIGQLSLARGTTSTRKGRVVRQSSPAGTQLAAGAPVAVKLGAR